LHWFFLDLFQLIVRQPKRNSCNQLETDFLCYVGVGVIDFLKNVVEVGVLLSESVDDEANFLPYFEAPFALVGHQNHQDLVQIVLKTGPNVLVFDSFENELDAVFIHPEVDNELQNERQNIHNAAFNFDIKIVSALWSLSFNVFSVADCGSDIVGQISDYLVVIVDFFLRQLGFRLVPDNVKVLLLFLVLVRFDLLNILQGLQLVILVCFRNLFVYVDVSST